MEDILPDKIETADDYATMSEINDMKQHANKIIQGIKKLDNNDYNRAIWELFQNAVDLSEKCHIEIKLTNTTFEFTHNGEPFTPMTLDCLFKQVSSKTLEEKKLLYYEGDPVGQYGTGFITTHAFGKEVTISGALLKGEGYISLGSFVINRSTDNWKILAKQISDLKKEVTSLLRDGQLHHPPFPNTRFIYTALTEQNKVNANKALSSLKLILPYVMALNSKLESVTVIDINNNQTIYKKKNKFVNGDLQIRPICVNDTIQEVCYLESEEITVILPINSNFHAVDFDDNLPRLFLYYPLIGTQTFGVNYIIHSRQFQPTEPRNGIYLKSDNDANEKDEKNNRQLLKKASQVVFDFFKTNIGRIASPIKLSTINFNIDSDDMLLNQYFKELKSEWIDQFKNYSIVETESGNRTPSESLFFHEELLADEDSFKAIYDLASKFWNNIPKIELTKIWTTKIGEWNIEEIKYLQIKDIAKRIAETGNISAFNQDNLKLFYKYLIDQEYSEIFNSYKLLPNIKGEFRFQSGNEGLNNSLYLSKEMVEIADILMPDVPKRHIHPDFKFSLDFTDYTRKNYASELNDYITKQIDEKSTSDKIQRPFLEKLLSYCKIITNTESTSVPTMMMKLISKYYGETEDMVGINNIKDDELDVRPSQKRLLRLFLNDICTKNSEWVINNLEFLDNVIRTGSNYYEYEEVFQTLSVFPNQLNELAKQNDLRIDENIPEAIKDLYDKVLKPDKPIRTTLVLPSFSEYLKSTQKRTIRDLTEKIESNFFEEQSQFNILDHPFKKEILDIIEEMKSSADYIKYFPLIYNKRSGILVELADGEDTFSILSLDSNRIKKLAEIGSNPHLDEIIRLGEEAFEKQREDNANFQHKYTIGTHIESVLRNSLSNIIPESIKAEIQDVQDGQDIIVKVEGSPIYFIEVKSRWDVNNPIRMSKNQTLKADKQKNNYALCSVDMTKYLGENKYDVQEIKEIIHCIRFNTTIGYEVTHLIEVLNQTNEAETIHLDGDFRTLVPMKYVDYGKTLSDFEDFIINHLKDRIPS